MAAIFISHSTKDKDAALRMQEWLRTTLGYGSIFLDSDLSGGIRAGADWKDELFVKLSRAQAVIVLLSPHWLASRWCFAEALQARGQGKLLLFARISPAEPDPAFADLQHVDLTGADHPVEEGHARLKRALAETFDWSGERPPYPGLPAFREEDAAVFFGRARETRAAMEAVQALAMRQPAAPRFLLVLGASGAGKSSLLRAGIVPRLRRQGGRWLIVPPFAPGRDPGRALVEALVAAGALDPALQIVRTFAEALRDPAEGAAVVREALTAWRLAASPAEREAHTLIAVDQVDDLTADTPRAAHFWRLLAALLEEAAGRILAVGTLRSDLMDRFQTHPGVAASTLTAREALPYETFALDPLPHDRFREIIAGPAKVAGLGVEEALADRMVADATSSDALPLLAYVLHRMWSARKVGAGGVLALAHYEALGGLDGTVAQAADGALAAALAHGEPREAETALREVFIPGLVELKDGDAPVRRYARLADLESAARADVRALIAPFLAARLLLTDADGSDGVLWVAHEAMFRNWPTLRRWIEEDRVRLATFAEVERDAADWLREGCPSERLNHRDGRLELALSVFAEPRFDRAAEPHTRAYLGACEEAQRAAEEAARRAAEERLAAAERIAREQAKARRRTQAGLAAALVLAALVAGFAWSSREQAARAVENAVAARDNEAAALAALSSVELAAGNPVRAAKLALAAWPRNADDPMTPLPVALEALSAAARQLRQRVRFAHDDIVRVRFAEDDGRVVTRHADGARRVWDAATGALLAEQAGGIGINAAYASVYRLPASDGRRVLAGRSRGGPWVVTDSVTGEAIRELEGTRFTDPVAISMDGGTVAAVVGDGLRVWRLDAGEEVPVGLAPRVRRALASVTGLELAEDGALLLLTGSRPPGDDPAGIFIDTRTGAAVADPERFPDRYAPSEVARLRAMSEGVLGVSRDGTMTVTSGRFNRTVDVRRGHVRRRMAAADLSLSRRPGLGSVRDGLSVDRDGRRIATAGGIFDLSLIVPGRTSDHDCDVTSLAMNRGPPVLVVLGCTQGQVVVDALEARGEPRTIAAHRGGGYTHVWDVALSPDATRLASAGRDGSVLVWTTADGSPIGALAGLDAYAGERALVAFSADGAAIAAASPTRLTRWQPEADDVVHQPVRQGQPAFLAFGADGRRVAVGDDDGRLLVWTPGEDGALLRIERAARAEGWDARLGAFRFDGELLSTTRAARGGGRIVTADGDIVDEATGARIASLPDGRANAVAISPDGALVATPAPGGAALWRIAAERGARGAAFGIPEGDIFRVVCAWLPWVNGAPDHDLSELADAFDITIAEPVCDYGNGYDPPLPPWRTPPRSE